MSALTFFRIDRFKVDMALVVMMDDTPPVSIWSTTLLSNSEASMLIIVPES